MFLHIVRGQSCWESVYRIEMLSILTDNILPLQMDICLQNKWKLLRVLRKSSTFADDKQQPMYRISEGLR